MPQTTKDTPMMQQYLAIKKDYQDAFLFYRIGDFYELFNDDAIKGSQILELTLTARNKSAQDPIPMCGVPHHAAQNYIDILIDKGYKVAICEQVEDPKLAQGMVKREVIQLITPGTMMDQNATTAKQNNYLTALTRFDAIYALAYSDLTTGEVRTTTLHTFNEVVNEVLNLNTKEVVVDEKVSSEERQQLQTLGLMISENKKISDSSEFHFVAQKTKRPGELAVLKILVNYLLSTQKRSLSHLQQAESYEIDQYLRMNHSAKSNLELFESLRTGKREGTLLWLLDKTKTAMGGRLLKQWLNRPLLNEAQLNQRQEVVATLIDHYFERVTLQQALQKVYDLERLAGRIAFGSANGRDLIQLFNSLSQIPTIKSVLQGLPEPTLQKIGRDLDELADIRDLIDAAINEETPVSITDGNVIKTGFNAQLDQYRSAMTDGQSWLAQMEADERKATGISTLKVGYNRVFGYYIEVTNANKKLVPTDRYQRKQTLTNAERYITPELKDRESLILQAREKSTELEYQLFVEVRDQIKDQTGRIQDLAKQIATLDVLQGFAVLSEAGRYVRPELSTKSQDIELINGRHPVVEKVLPANTYIPNSVIMKADTNILLITGPNMSGKSTYMRQLGLIVIMAQVGCFVPAESAKLPIFDQIFTRIGAADDLISGESTFMVEMKEANDALLNGTSHSLLLFDELGRGTATYDGIALADAIIEYIHDHLGAKTLFSTHYHELTQLSERLEKLENVHVGATEENGKLIFLHQVLPGPADKSYGIHVAKLAGLPSQVTKHAAQVLHVLEADGNELVNEDLPLTEQLPLFTIADKPAPEKQAPPQIPTEVQTLIDQIKTTNLLQLTPIDAMNLINEWQKSLN
ncbi:DNA mismatch repair protein MutS [Lapidilactobacillus mulanensis]|uniref:DNA mismatch repair protein MutS n=1 Tax=Lapidilactobacillus mulanensis TaxID=2485999 RepID=A0ABW4DLU0_9LACO|nr:DNA mismatch repair protein MutS [Lapidilactobacillus mulanensis]